MYVKETGTWGHTLSLTTDTDKQRERERQTDRQRERESERCPCITRSNAKEMTIQEHRQCL